MKHFLKLISVVTVCCFSTCGNVTTTTSHKGLYTLDEPDRKYLLDKDLREISGISLIDPTSMACVQDEKGILFILDLESGAVRREIKFGEKGDYEDLEIIEDDCYVLESNGDLHFIKNFQSKNLKVDRIKTDLCGKNDVEGLTVDLKKEKLLLACKGAANICKEDKGHRAVFSFDIRKEKLEKEALIRFNLDKLQKKFDEKRIASFAPSGIAIHPIHKDTYVISTNGKLLMVLDSENKVKEVHSLRYLEMKQPEGICFNEKGDLYISNEGRDGRANILMFKSKASHEK